MSTFTILLHADDHAGNFLEDYWSILTDPAHVAVELTLMLIFDVLLLGLIWPLMKKVINRKISAAHKQLDIEHGIVHHGDHVHRITEATIDCEEEPHGHFK